eukprot:TRINITY_DN14570_c1_g1_i1.p1 TRINITY_DN14570_c1_g1~~TRINITY_DN14570_c1_g1_i1.p1  ORF type:complete len:812 (+),score=82.01 TRINITY_DN14570_c1_g1_i1:61-2496(+)
MLSSPTHASSFLASPVLHQPGKLKFSDAVTVDSPSDSSDFSGFTPGNSTSISNCTGSCPGSRSDLLGAATKQRGSVFGSGPVRGLGGRRASTNGSKRGSNSSAGGGKHRRRAGRYRKGKMLGAGATGTVYQGIDQLTGQFVAIKEVKTEGYDELRREFDLLQRLKHNNIVRYFEFEVNNKRLTMYMELVDGGSLASMVAEYGKLSEPVLQHYVRQITSGLGYLHANKVIHRDIKPGNLLVTTNGTVKLADFGTSKTLSVDDPRRASRDFVGTAIYASPEAIRGDSTFASDIWSMGVTIVELATGADPWDGVLKAESPLEFILKLPKEDLKPATPADLSENCRVFIEQCLKRDPLERPECDKLIHHDFLTHEVVSNILEGGMEPLRLLRSESDLATKTGLGLRALRDQPQLPSIEVSDEEEDQMEMAEHIEMQGLYIAAHCCNDDQANIVFENIQDRSTTECSISRSRPFTPSVSPYSARGLHGACSFTRRLSVGEYGEVTGTPDGLISLKLPAADSEDGIDGIPTAEVEDSSFKFDVFFDEKTSPHGLFERIGDPIIDNMLNGKFGKKISLTCSSMMYAGECCMSIGKLTHDISIRDDEGQGFTPIFIKQIFRRCGAQYDIYVSSISAKRDKNAVFDNIHRRVVEDEDVIWKWATLGPVLRKKASSVNETFEMMDLAQLAFSGVMAPQMFVIELADKQNQGGPLKPRSTLYLSLFYGRQWIYWLNGVTHSIQKYFAYGDQPDDDAIGNNSLSAFDEEARLYRHPLLVLTEEVFRDEHSMNYVLHNFHTKVDNMDDIVDSLTALSNAARRKK